jgi:hypothetical protein
LRVLRGNHETEAVPFSSLIRLLQNNAATLEELRLSARTLLQEDYSAAAAASSASSAALAPVLMPQLAEALTRCVQLREVELPQCAGLTAALSHAPALQTLRLHCKANFLLSAAALNLPRCMIVSTSWCSTHLYLADNEPTATLRDAAALERIWPAGSLAQANPSAIRRLRLFVHCDTVSKRQRISRAFRLQTIQAQAAAAASNGGQRTNAGSVLQWHRESVEQQRID